MLILKLIKAWFRLTNTTLRTRLGLPIDMQIKMVMYVRDDGTGTLHFYHVRGSRQKLTAVQELDAEAVVIFRNMKGMDWL